jgi:hypothetical protein
VELAGYLHADDRRPGTGDLRRALGIPRRWVTTSGTPKEAVMFIGQVEEIGVIEPLVFPRAVATDDTVVPATEPDEPVPEPAAAM